MKTKSIVLTGALLTLFVASIGTSYAGANKYSQYKEVVGGTKGASQGEVSKHANKYCRTVMERDGMGGSIFPSTTGVQGNSKYSR